MIIATALAAIIAGLAICVLAIRAPERIPGNFLQQILAFIGGVAMTLLSIGWLASLLFEGS